MTGGVPTGLKRLAGKSIIYGLGQVFLRGIGFFLLPLYTRYLTPAEYGVVAVGTTVAAVLSVLLPLGLHGSLARVYFDADSEIERRRRSGTVWVVMVLWAATLTLLLDQIGGQLFPLLFADVPFQPYIRLALWTAFFNVFSLVPLGLLQIREQAGAYVLATATGTLLNVACVAGAVVALRAGAYGYLTGALVASAIMAVPYSVLTLRQIDIGLQRKVAAAALAYSLPLVPHGVASWVLELSDRIVLERYVPLSQLGLYSLGYQISLVLSIVAAAVNSAWVPFLFRTNAEEGLAAAPMLARLATFYAMGLCWMATGVALFGKPAVLLLMAPEFAGAYRIIPWIVAGLLMSGLYLIPVNFLFLRSRTGIIPIVTILSGLANLGLNLWLVPRFGVIAAAWGTFVAYSLMLVLVWMAARRVYPLPYEFRRLARVGALTAVLMWIGTVLPSASSVLDLLVRVLLWALFPVGLVVSGLFSRDEIRAASSGFQRGRQRVASYLRTVIAGGTSIRDP